MNFTLIVPRQLLSSHCLVRLADPNSEQSLPPCFGTGLLQYLVDIEVPPHAPMQEVQDDQSEYPPSTKVNMNELRENFEIYCYIFFPASCYWY